MASNPQRRYTEDLELDPRVDSPGREGLTGTASSDLYKQELEDISVAPDRAVEANQPQWRKDFPIDWPADQFVARRDFAKFLVLTSGAFVVGQGWILAKHLLRKNRPAPPRLALGSASALPIGSATTFNYPNEHSPCLLIRTGESTFVAYSQLCTHLSCAVVPKVSEGLLHCPCHEGYFDLATGRVVAGPPPRPLPKVELEIVDGSLYAISMEERTV